MLMVDSARVGRVAFFKKETHAVALKTLGEEPKLRHTMFDRPRTSKGAGE